MKKALVLSVTLLMTSASSQVNWAYAEQGNLELRGPVPTEGTTTLPDNQQPIAGFTAPGADAMMTPDMLLVNPTPGTGQTPRPLQAFIGH